MQIWQDIELCRSQYGTLVARPVAAQFIDEGNRQVIAMFEFEIGDGPYDIVVSSEHHYVLVPHKAISDDDLATYQHRTLD